jgi:hypothetical protein
MGDNWFEIIFEILKKRLGEAGPSPSNHGSTHGDGGSALQLKEIT